MNLKFLSDNRLLEGTLTLVSEECEYVTKVLHHLKEIERRKLYSSLGYPSLFEYVVDKLGYSEAEAYRRISAMRVMTEIPEVEEKIASGAISLTNITLAQTVFRREFKIHGKKISKADKCNLLTKLEGKTTRQAEKVVMEVTSSPVSLMSDKIRPVGDDAVEIRFAGNQELIQKIAQLRGLLAHREPNMSLGELFEKLCDLGIQNWSPQFAAPRKHRVEKSAVAVVRNGTENAEGTNGSLRTNQESSNDTVHLGQPQKQSPKPPAFPAIPAEVRRMIWRRDKGRCRKCGSLYMLEVDHIHPRAMGGSNAPENLRLLCRVCNQRSAISTYGIAKIEVSMGKAAVSCSTGPKASTNLNSS